MRINKESFTLLNSNGEINGDIHLVPNHSDSKGVVIFAHGYKGFKDWGAWSVLADDLAREGWIFVRFNFTHNGHSAESPLDCTELDKWSENTYLKEYQDCSSVVDWASDRFTGLEIALIGHSRGGGIATITAAHNNQVKKLFLLASVSDFAKRFPQGEKLKEWEETDRLEVINGRTGQVLHHKYGFYTNYFENEIILNIERCAKKLSIPVSIFHGSNDEAVNVSEAMMLDSWIQNSSLTIVEGAGHTFNTSHPWGETELSREMEEVKMGLLKGLA